MVALVALWRRIVIFRQEKLDSDVEKDARLADMRAERDAWKAVAEASVAIQEKQADVAEGQSRDIAQLANATERVATILEVVPPRRSRPT
jgi:hypothetical protein